MGTGVQIKTHQGTIWAGMLNWSRCKHNLSFLWYGQFLCTLTDSPLCLLYLIYHDVTLGFDSLLSNTNEQTSANWLHEQHTEHYTDFIQLNHKQTEGLKQALTGSGHLPKMPMLS